MSVDTVYTHIHTYNNQIWYAIKLVDLFVLRSAGWRPLIRPDRTSEASRMSGKKKIRIYRQNMNRGKWNWKESLVRKAQGRRWRWERARDGSEASRKKKTSKFLSTRLLFSLVQIFVQIFGTLCTYIYNICMYGRFAAPVRDVHTSSYYYFFVLVCSKKLQKVLTYRVLSCSVQYNLIKIFL